MDALLSGYGSSSSESDQETGVVATTTTTTTRTQPEEQQPQQQQRITATATMNQQQPILNRKGRRILSLASVLPQHIVDQLTKSQVQASGADNNDDDDDDSADDDDDTIDQMGPTIDRGGAKTTFDAHKTSITNLLSDLHQAARSDGGAKKPKKQATTATASSLLKASTLPQQRERMGAAFLQSTTTTTVKPAPAGADTAGVRDIHAESTQPVEPATATKSTTLASQPFVKPAPTASFRRATAVTAAPALVTVAHAAHPPQPTPAPYYQQPHSNDAAFTSHHNDDEPAVTAADERASRKRSRRDMQRALRQGDLTAVQDADNNIHVSTVEQADPDAYQPAPETYAVPAHGIRVAPTALYDPAAGKAVPLAAGDHKVRGKNQIHHLMASAASLELQRARGIGSGSTGGGTGRGHRW